MVGHLTVIALAVAVLSIAGNVGQAWLYLGLRDDLATAHTLAGQHQRELDQVQSTALACGNAVDNLHALAQQRERETTTARAAAAATARAAAQRADAILAAPAAVPGNDCASAQVRVGAWLESRKAQ
jgi:hypothetical protein